MKAETFAEKLLAKLPRTKTQTKNRYRDKEAALTENTYNQVTHEDR